MEGSFDISEIFKMIGSLFNYFKGNKDEPNSPKTVHKKQDFGFDGAFQSPIKSSWKNLGDYIRGRYINKMHPKGHDGIDMACPRGTPIYPIADGIVSFVGTDPVGGTVCNTVHANGVRAYYAHCDKIVAKKGDRVSKDTVIATVGDSGNAKGTTHLHLQIWKDGSLQNPSAYFSVPRYGKKTQEETAIAAKNISDLIKIAEMYDFLTKNIKF